MAVTIFSDETFRNPDTPEQLRSLLDTVLRQHDIWYHNNELIDDLIFAVSIGFQRPAVVQFFRRSVLHTPLATVECSLSTSILHIFSKANLRVAL